MPARGIEDGDNCTWKCAHTFPFLSKQLAKRPVKDEDEGSQPHLSDEPVEESALCWVDFHVGSAAGSGVCSPLSPPGALSS